MTCILLVFVYGILAVKANSTNIIRERLVEETRLACAVVKNTDGFSELSGYYGERAFRITVIDLEGNVLFETNLKSTLENHFDREEFKNAIRNTPKAVERYSDTFGCVMTYYAEKAELKDGTKVVVRMAIRSSEISNYFVITLPILFVVFCLALGFSLIFSDLISKKVTSKITDVGDSLKSLNDGNYVPIKTSSREPELYSVLNQINELNSSIHNHIEKETEERNKLNTVLENITQGILAVGEDKKIIFCNKSAGKLFGAKTDEENKELVYLIDDLKLCDEITESLGKDVSFEYPYDGKELSVVVKKVEGVNGNGEVCSIVIITDVTKERAMTKQKSDFFANASHELKTPVAVMQGLSELLLEKDLDEGSRKQVERINKESVRLASLISDMLKLSLLENGEHSGLVKADVNLKETVNEVLSELSTKMTEKGITATVSGDGTVRGDGKKIFELTENLLYNAVNYNKENGKIKVDISENADNVILKAEDTGIGIDKENLPRLCERFYRVDKSRSKKTGGTGLGLAIVKHICALHDATLSIDSDPGIGTTVTVTFKKDDKRSDDER